MTSRAVVLANLASSNILEVDSTTDRVGIGSTQPTTRLDVSGNIKAVHGNFTGVVTATTGTFNGPVTIGGTLTYEDVTNIDSVGIITARSDVSIADKIIHTGDTNTAIRFPANDTFTVETGGAENARFTSSAITFKAPDGGSRYLFGELGNSAHAELSLYNSSDAQKVRIAANNATFFNGGNVGIATNNTSYANSNADDLVIGSSSSSTERGITLGSSVASAIRFADAGNASAGMMQYVHNAGGTDYMNFYTAATERVRILSDGAVIVGDGTNWTKYVSDANFQITDNTNPKLVISNPGNATFSLAVGTGNDLIIRDESQAADRMIIDYATGLVGIGTNNPALPSGNGLEIHHATVPRLKFSNSTTGSAGGDGFQIYAFGSDAHLENKEAGNVIFYTSGTEKVRVTDTGDVGINCTPHSNAGINLHIHGDNTTSEIRLTNTTTGTGANGSYIQQGGNTLYIGNTESGNTVFEVNGAERLRILSDGELQTYCTGSTSFNIANNKSAGTSNILIYGQHSSTALANGTASFIVYTNGNVQNTNNSYGSISDIKLKENIIDAGSQWSDFKSVKFRKFNFKAETGHETNTQLGVVAQELELTSPGLVYETADKDSDGNDLGTTTKSVKSSVLTMKALVALQEAMARIETLESKVAALESS